MSPAALITLGVFVMAVVLFITEKVPVEVTALLVLVTLSLTGVLSVDEALAGFSNPATVTVAAMFILSAGLYRTGAVNIVGTLLTRAGKRSFWLGALAMMLGVSVISAFINNTAAVAIFLPVALLVARQTGASPSKLLIPLSYASIFGGFCTLIGTSTNILVGGIAQAEGIAALGVFEFARVGVPLALIGIVYMMTIGVRIIPERRRSEELTESYEMVKYLTEIVVLPGSPSIGFYFAESPLVRELGLDVIEVLRGGKRVPVPAARTIVQEGDVLVVRCNVEAIREIQERVGVALRPHVKWRDEDLQSVDAVLVEAVVAPHSLLEGKTLKEIRFRNRFGATVLALRHAGTLLHEKLSSHVLQGGDTLLIEARRDHLAQLRDYRAFVFVNAVETTHFRRNRMLPAVVIVALAVGLAATGVLPIVVTAIAGCIAMALTGVIDLDDAYRAVEWRVILLLAGILPLGTALQKSGAAAGISGALVESVGVWGGPVAVIGALYLVTNILTEVMSNNAAAALLAPIALVTASTMGIDARPLLFAVAFGASAGFMSPVGYQTHLMVYGPGGYRFTDFIRVGLPLNVLFLLAATWLIPRAWPP